ncbi:hypothetical protein KTC92_07045 [Clostridium sp. CM027]|uniref:hypothetical protein n=1 Tax=Clostridium sp. CM027 TaxID=2849865 RepID=UPI001C6E159C|nr:hypothetical protein [Clostridium sp. CM027]MBW9147354.1 hypothetical protein [Clostridium sp. CM027]UVE42194.1 hypothetical protein KTC92_07045 [Clostridium sp. CM027]
MVTVFAATNSNYTVNVSSINATTVTKSTTATQNEAIKTQMKINETIANKALANKGNAKDIIDNGSVRNTRSVPSAAAKKAVKAAAKWMKANKAKVIKAIPAPLKKYVTFDALTKAIDAYTNYSDSIHNFLTSVVDKMLPEWAEISIPGIVALLELLLPF